MSFRIVITSIVMLFAIVMGISPSYAERVTYSDVIKEAINNSARVRVKIEDIRIAHALYKQNYGSLYPEISVNSRTERYENLDKRSQGLDTISGEIVGGDVSSWRSSVYLSGDYYISNWYKKRYEALYYEKLKDVRVHECAAETKKLLQELTDVYSSMMEGKIKLRYGYDILQRLKCIFALKKETFAKGNLSYEDVIKSEADVVNTDKEIAGIRKELKENLEKLISYTGKAYREETEMAEFVHGDQREFASISMAIEDTPEYKARMKEHEAQITRAKGSANNLWPDISLYGRYDYYGSNANGPDSAFSDVREASYRVGMLISIPLIDGGSRSWERKRSVYEIKKLEEGAKAVAEEQGRGIKTLSAGYTELSKAHKHYRKLADQYGKMLDITKKAHVLGERSVTDILEMEKDALGIERDLKVTEHSMAAYEKRFFLATDYWKFMMEHYGDGACKY